jgi:hypothetical protein
MRRWSRDIAPEIIQFHVEMLNDKSRTSGYIKTIRKIVHPGDVVVDIGTGTGIMAIAAAQAGARRVYAIEAGRIGEVARHLFAINGFADRITLLHGWSTKTWLPERADVLISELIGNEPLAEGVIGITRDARRRLLKPGARLMPSGIKLFGLPVMIPDRELNKLTFTPQTLQNWESWYGITFGQLAKNGSRHRHQRLSSRFGYLINPHRIRTWKPLSTPVLLADIDFNSWSSPWILTTKTAVADAAGRLNALVMYFELQAGSTSFLSTHPTMVDDRNHWLSPVRVFTEPIALQSGDQFKVTYWYRPLLFMSGCTVRIAKVNRDLR